MTSKGGMVHRATLVHELLPRPGGGESEVFRYSAGAAPTHNRPSETPGCQRNTLVVEDLLLLEAAVAGQPF